MVIIIAAPVITSCKKGEEDPFLSLKSRKARLVGEWKLVSGTQAYTSNGVDVRVTYSGSIASFVADFGVGSYPYVETMTFGKNNEFKKETIDNGKIRQYEGFWSFMNGNDEIANKECIVVRKTKSFINDKLNIFSGDNMPVTVLRLLKLSSKEIILEYSGTEVSSETEYSTTSKITYEKK